MAPLKTQALANHPRGDEVQRLYTEEVVRFRSGEKNVETVFIGPIRDNTGQTRTESRPDLVRLFDENGQWFAANVVGSPRP